MKVMICLGTRPEIIKMSTTIKVLKQSKDIDCIVCLSGQHRELAENVANELGIEIDYNLDIMKKNQSLQYVLSVIVENLTELIKKEKPDFVVVHGDTSTCFSSALCAFYEQIPVIYIEAGWRSKNIETPFPEEMHRRVVTKIAKYFLCSTKDNYNNLILEGIDKKNIFITGNPIIDVLKQTISKNYYFPNQIINDSIKNKVVLITFHRRENRKKTYDFFDIIYKISKEKKDLVFLWIAHPSIIDILNNLFFCVPNVNILAPLGIYDMHNLIYRASIILTDSGGVQEEAYLLKKNAVILRNNIERTELLNEHSILSEIDFRSIKKSIEYFLKNQNVFDSNILINEQCVGNKISKIITEVSYGNIVE